MMQSQSGVKKALNKKNHLFKEVIVEDEAEDLRGSQIGSDANIIGMGNYGGGSAIGKKGVTDHNLISMNRDSNSPTP